MGGMSSCSCDGGTEVRTAGGLLWDANWVGLCALALASLGALSKLREVRAGRTDHQIRVHEKSSSCPDLTFTISTAASHSSHSTSPSTKKTHIGAFKRASCLEPVMMS